MNPILFRWEEIRSGRDQTPAIFDPQGAILRTFGQIEAEAIAWTEKLTPYAGRVLGLQLGNAPEWPALLLAAWRAGCTVVPLDPEVTGERRERLERLCGLAARVEPGGALISLENPVPAWPGESPDFLKLTSGTTAEPRAIRFRAAQLLADCDAVCDTMGLRESDRNYGVIAFSHSYGFSNLVTPLICRGIPLVTAVDMIPRAVAEGLARSGATVLPGVPAIFRSMAGLSAPASALRLCLSAGAPLTAEAAAAFHAAWGLKIHSFYGSSECGGICYDPGDEPNRPFGFVGPAFRGVTLRPLSQANPSLMRVEGQAVGLGYFPEADATLSDGGFEPPDLLESTPEGYVIRGRVSDVINVAGRKVNPGEIEQILRRAPGVRDAVVLGLPTAARGEEVAACVVGETNEEALRRHCAHRLPAWQVPKQWFFWNEIPLNPRGKVSRADLRARILA